MAPRNGEAALPEALPADFFDFDVDFGFAPPAAADFAFDSGMGGTSDSAARTALVVLTGVSRTTVFGSRPGSIPL